MKVLFFENIEFNIFASQIKTLGPTLVRKELRDSMQVLRPVSSLPNVIELSYYSNCVLPIYAMEAVVGKTCTTLIPFEVHFLSI